jgi:hypothetical protein
MARRSRRWSFARRENKLAARLIALNFDQFHLTPLAQILAGVALLLFGRRLFWVFVGVIGFIAGMRFGSELVKEQPEVVILLIAVGTGLVGGLLAIVLQRVAVAVAGGLAGGMIAMEAAATLGSTSEPTRWIFFFIGAVLAAILVLAVFDWALILLSALSGANLVGQALPFGHAAQSIVIGILFLAGVLAQARMLGGSRSES